MNLLSRDSVYSREMEEEALKCLSLSRGNQAKDGEWITNNHEYSNAFDTNPSGRVLSTFDSQWYSKTTHATGLKRGPPGHNIFSYYFLNFSSSSSNQKRHHLYCYVELSIIPNAV